MNKIYRLFLINFFITITLASFYLVITPDINLFFAVIALVSHVATIYFILFICSFIILYPIKTLRKKIFMFLPFFLLLHIATVSDLLIYKIFKYHINGLVINVVLTPGGIEALDLPVSNYLYYIFLIFLFAVLEFFIALKVLKNQNKPFVKPVIVFLILICFIISDKTLYAYYDVMGYNSVVKVKKLFPLYLPFTCKKFLRKVLHVKIAQTYKFKIKTKHAKNVRYPLQPIKLKENNIKPNIVWILLDAWRRDAFNKNLTPNIYEFSRNALVFTNHRSGGIATRFGVFSLFYGIYGTYWHRFLENETPPLFLSILQKLKYDFKILTSSPLTFPEFDRTVFVNLHDKLPKNRPGKTAALKDMNITNSFVSWINKRDNSSKPFFSFIFMDAPHAKSFLPRFKRYKADKNANYLIVGKKNVTKIRNAYLNAVITDDFLCGKIIRALKEKKLLENTVVLISADHGEEFYEHGHLGHTSAFTPEQNDVPLILYIPGTKHKIYKKLTCHYDIVPTIMRLLGVKSDEKFYSNGLNLTGAAKHKYIISSSWTNFAVIYNDFRFIFSMASYKAGLFEIRDNNFKKIDSSISKKIFKQRIKDFANITRDLSRF